MTPAFKCTKCTKAFTLAELLMAVLIISIIMVALAPVITRRAYDSISIETNRKKGEEIWTNPGTYTFQVPIGINLIEISGSGGGGGGAGAISKNYSRTYNTAGTRTITVPKGVSQITFTLMGAGGGGGGANALKKNDTCKYPLTITSSADNGKDLCVSNLEPPKGSVWFTTLDVGEQSTRENTCWVASATRNTAGYCSTTSWPSASPYFKGGGCKKFICTREGATSFCAQTAGLSAEDSRYIGYRLFTVEEIKRLEAQSTPSNNYKWIFGSGLDMGMHMYKLGALTGGRFTASNEAYGCMSPITSVCSPYIMHLQNGAANIRDSDYWNVADPDGPLFERYGIQYTAIQPSIAAQVRCVRELNNWDQYSGAGGASGARLTKTINVQPGDTLIITTGAGGAGGNKGGGSGSQGGSTCLEHKRNGARYVDPTNTINNGYYCAYGGYGAGGASASANGTPNPSLAGCTHSDGCTKSANGESGGSSKGGRGANGGEGATADLGQNSVAGVGYDSTSFYGGGGGGYCPRGNRTPSNCQKGGKGGIGGFTLTFDQFVPGGGGGAAGAAGLNEDGTYKPIKLSVEASETITFTIGAGGMGGQFSSPGQNGGNTIIARKNNSNVFTLYGGLGGKTGSFSGSCAYDNQACGIGGLGGSGGQYPNPSLTPGSFSYLSAALKANGIQGGLDSKGFFGGGGAMTPLNKTGVCGGFEVDTNTSCAKYDADGNDAQKHNPITNRLGGQGGGGGGTDGKTGGAAGSGASGYLRIKWDESEQE